MILSIVLLGSLLVALALPLLGLVRWEYTMRGALSRPTVVAAYVFYIFHAALTVVASWQQVWPLPLPAALATLSGGSLVLGGLLLYNLALATMRSPRRVSGLETDVLVTRGVYAWTRNPQNVAWGLTLLGFALVGSSGLALGLAVLFWMLSHAYIHIEEQHLERTFGTRYMDYCIKVPRYGRVRLPFKLNR